MYIEAPATFDTDLDCSPCTSYELFPFFLFFRWCPPLPSRSAGVARINGATRSPKYHILGQTILNLIKFPMLILVLVDATPRSPPH